MPTPGILPLVLAMNLGEKKRVKYGAVGPPLNSFKIIILMS